MVIKKKPKTIIKPKVTNDTPNIVDSGEYKKFLIQWRAGRVIVRSGLGAGPVVMEWTDENPFPITHFGVRTAWGATGNWILQTKGAQIARSGLNMEYICIRRAWNVYIRIRYKK